MEPVYLKNKKNDDLSDLVARAKNGDREAMSDLIERTQKRMYRFCWILTGDKALGEDLCHDTYLKAFKNLSKLSDPVAFGSWLFTIARNLFLDQVRLKKNRPNLNIDDLGGNPLQLEQSSRVELVVQFQQVLGFLKPDDRYLLLLVELEGHSYAETSQIMKISEQAVRSRLHRIRQVVENKVKFK